MDLIRLAGLVGLVVALTLAAGAQPSSVVAPVVAPMVAITHVEGKVYVDEKPVEMSSVLNGDGVVRTEGGRAEIRLRSGTVFLGENSSIRVIMNRPYNFNRLEMLGGSALVATGEGGGFVICEDTVTLSDGGVFRLDLHQGYCRFRVFQGAASVQLKSIATALTMGKAMNLNHQCGDMIPWDDFDLQEIDDLDRWSRASRE